MIKVSAPGRAGIIGNPTDGYGGSMIACSTKNRAYVTIERADDLIIENAVAKHEYAHDDEGNIISQKNFGEFEVNGKLVPISDANGVHEYRYSYFDLYEDGTPLFNPCMNQRKENGILLKPFDCALKIERFGIMLRFQKSQDFFTMLLGKIAL